MTESASREEGASDQTKTVTKVKPKTVTAEFKWVLGDTLPRMFVLRTESEFKYVKNITHSEAAVSRGLCGGGT